MSSNIKSTPVSRSVDSRFTQTVILWTMVVGVILAGYLALCIWFARIRETNGMAATVKGPFGEITQFDGGLPNWDILVSMADTGVFLANWGFWMLAGVAVLVAVITLKRSSFIQGYRNS